MRIFVMMGTTLAGKTAHGKKLAQNYSMEYISSGDIARSLMDDKTKSEFAEGKLSPHDDKIRTAIYERILGAMPYKDVLLDGFPRTSAHVIDFITWCEGAGFAYTIVVVNLDVPASVVIARLKNRVRDQFDTSEVVLKRHNLYLSETAPALNFLGTRKGVELVKVTLVAEAEFGQVHSALMGTLEDRSLV